MIIFCRFLALTLKVFNMSEFLSFYFLIFVNLTLLWLLSSFIEKKLTKTLELEAASNPKTSKHWLKLINHFLKLNQVQKARESSAKALKEIPFEAERDRLNIWTALAALEIDFGTAQSFGVALQNCVARCEPHFAYQRVIEVLVAKGRFKVFGERDNK